MARKPPASRCEDAARSTPRSADTAGRIRVAVVDDHPIMCAAIASTFATHPLFEVVGKGGTADEAIEIARSLGPDLILIDLNMPGCGVRAISEISANIPNVKTLVVTAHDDHQNVTRALCAGADGYTLKGISGSELIGLASSIVKGNRYFPSELAIRLLKAANTDVPMADESQVDASPTDTSNLTLREWQILKLISKGLSNHEIGVALDLAESTVKNHVTRILEKLDARNRVEAAMKALRVAKI